MLSNKTRQLPDAFFPTPATEESLMLKQFMLVSVMALVVFAPLAASAQAAPGKNSAKSGSEAEAKAKKVYAMDCALCHGDSGDGKTDLAKDMQLTLIDWTDPKSLSDKQDQDLFKVIRDGKGKMPPEDKSRASDDEIQGIIKYIRTFSKNGPATPAAPAPPAAAPAAATATTPAPSNK
jgi:cytochrome c5